MDYSAYDGARYLPTTLEAFEQGNRTLDAISCFFDSKDVTQRVLEIGCASGSLLKVLQEKGFALVKGIDIDPKLTSHGREALGVNIQNADWSSFVSTEVETYDLIIALDVIEHISPKAIEDVLRNTRERLSSRGKLILRMPNPACPFVLSTFCGDLTHKLLMTAGLLEYLLKKSGFNGVITYKETQPHHKIKKYIHFFLHHFIVRPVVILFYYHFYGQSPGPITRNMYCCVSRNDESQ